MYRVAVIQNESEMQRTGYANVITKLQKDIKVNYSFELYTVVNISDLFEKGQNHLSQYDSLIITTNATSDKPVYDKLVKNKKEIETFIEKGKGIFIASQKKLGKNNSIEKHTEGTDFLPDKYDFCTVPRTEASSGEGKISFFDKTEILLKYPEQIDENKINQKCESNPFMKHFYRSLIQPVEKITYTPILVDNSYQDENNKLVLRNLLMKNAFPEHGERIVISTIAIDWEYHKQLLKNIITFITEGLPQIAFIDKNKSTNIKCLKESANILNKSYATYSNFNDTTLNDERKKIHNIYIVSDDYTEQEIKNFVKGIDGATDFIKKRVYWIKEEDNVLKLTRYSNYSSIDKIINNSVAWLKSQHLIGSGMWNSSFWTTFEIFMLFEKLNINLNDYIIPVLDDIKGNKEKSIKGHYQCSETGSSYDGVVSATCELIQLLLLLKEKGYEQSILTDVDLSKMIAWISEEKRFNAQSPFDKRNVVFTLGKVKNSLNDYNITQERYSEMIKDSLQTDADNTDEFSEIEICQLISIRLLLEEDEDTQNRLKKLLNIIKNNQTPVGTWSEHKNIGSTSYILIFLLQNFNKLKLYINENDLEDIIYRGILFLRSKFKNKKNWGDDDIQATAKAAHAIFLYNEKNHSSMYDYDILKIIEEEDAEIASSTVIKDLTDNLKKHKEDFKVSEENRIISENEKQNLQNEKTNLEKEKEHSENEFNKKQTINDAITYSLIVIVAILVTFLLKGVIEDNIWYSIIAGFVTAIILGGAKFVTRKFNKIKSKSKK